MRDYQELDEKTLSVALIRLTNSKISYSALKREAEEELEELKYHERIAYEKSQSSYGMERINKEKEKFQIVINYLREKLAVVDKELEEVQKNLIS